MKENQRESQTRSNEMTFQKNLAPSSFRLSHPLGVVLASGFKEAAPAP